MSIENSLDIIKVCPDMRHNAIECLLVKVAATLNLNSVIKWISWITPDTKNIDAPITNSKIVDTSHPDETGWVRPHLR